MSTESASIANAMTTTDDDDSESSVDVDGSLLGNWVVTDLALDVLQQHPAWPALQGLGVRRREADAFRICIDPEFQSQEPTLVIMSCFYPPSECSDYLRKLIKHYARFDPNAADRRRYYAAFAHDAVEAQMEHATVITVSRITDEIVAGKTPTLLAPMVNIPGYCPKACNRKLSAPLLHLQAGDQLQVKVNLQGPLDPRTFLNCEGAFDLVLACASATALGFKVAFLGEWDGALSHQCACGVRSICARKEVPPLRHLGQQQPIPLRTLGGWTGRYQDFYSYAVDKRYEDLLRSMAKSHQQLGDTGATVVVPHDTIQPHASLNAACMWFFADLFSYADCPQMLPYGKRYKQMQPTEMTMAANDTKLVEREDD